LADISFQLEKRHLQPADTFPGLQILGRKRILVLTVFVNRDDHCFDDIFSWDEESFTL